MFLPELRDEISQGDIFDAVPVAEQGVLPDGTTLCSVVLLSHDCEFDKPSVSHVLVARTYPLTAAGRPLWGDIRAGRALNTMFLDGVEDREEGFVNFRYIHRIPKVELLEAASGGRRVASMSDDGRAALLAYMFRFFARRLP